MELTKNTSHGEPSVLSSAAFEFSQVESMIEPQRKYLGPTLGDDLIF